MIRAFLSLLAILLLSVVPARAQDATESIDVERFKPAITHDPFVITEGSAVSGYQRDDPLLLAVDFNAASNPLMFVGPQGDVLTRIVERRLGFDLLGSYTLSRRVEIGLALPLFAAQVGDDDPNPAGLGDLRLVPKFRLTGGAAGGLALVTELRLPTHTDNEFSGGARSPVFAPRLALDRRIGNHLRLGLNAGVLLRERTEYRNIEAGSELTYSGAIAYYFGGFDGDVAVGLDLHGGSGLAAIDREELPLEGQLYARVKTSPDTVLQLGPAAGLIPGYGTPNFRFYAGLTWAPDRGAPLAGAAVGAVGAEHQCPACPEDDPSEGLVRAIVIDRDGEPIRTSSARVDDLPATPTGPGVHEVEVAPGRHTLWVRAKGYVPQKIPVRVPRGGEVEKTVVLDPIEFTFNGDRLEYNGIVYFAFDSDRLVRESHDLLDEVADVLDAYPQIKRLRVAGHTDNRGTNEYNLDLSRRRAGSVMTYLIEIGVDPDRLEAAGYGEEQPVSNVHRENRRVEFVIVRGRVPGATIFNRSDPAEGG